jgi:hypothetical protein
MKRPMRRRLPVSLLPLIFPVLLSARALCGDVPLPPAVLSVVDRSITQERGQWQAWKIDYRFRNSGQGPLVIAPEGLSAKVDGWVSNSRVASHATCRRSTVVVTGTSGLSAYSEVISSTDEDQRCRERVVLQVWSAELGDEPPEPISKAVVRPVELKVQPTWKIAPGGVVRIRLRLEHVHFLYGPYDPLLGPRSVELHLGSATVRDLLPLDRERRPAPASPTDFPAPPPDRMDRHVYLSPPESLHLEAHVPGNQSYRFERAVRYGTRMRLRYWYLIAPGTEGECKAQIRQFKDASIWRELPDGSHEQTLCAVGRWTRVERIFRTEVEATTLALEFRILGSGDVGEMWVDDISLEILGDSAKGP